MRPVTAEGILATMSDGVSLVVRRQLVPIAGGEPIRIPGLPLKVRIARIDGQSVWTTGEKDVVRVDRVTGQRETITDYGFGSPKQSLFTGPPLLSADGRAYAFTYGTVTSELYVVEGAR
jgi:hypothetical protein